MIRSQIQSRHVLVAGQVRSDDAPGKAIAECPADAAPGMSRCLRHRSANSAANIANCLSELGAVVGLLGVSGQASVENAEQDVQMAQFDALLPQYDLVVLSNFPRSSLKTARHMIFASRKAGKQILVCPLHGDFFQYPGSSLLIQSQSTIGGLAGRFRERLDLAATMKELRAAAAVEAMLITQLNGNMLLCADQKTARMPMPASHVFHLPCDEALIAILAFALAHGRSLRAAFKMLSRIGAAFDRSPEPVAQPLARERYSSI
jgi:hypothetical protein